MQEGDVVLIPAGIGNPVPIAAMITSVDAVLGFREKATCWLDINMLGQHLPQMYRPSEFEEATTEQIVAYGLCTECKGYGSKTLQAVAVGVDEITDPCEVCAGVGRAAVRVRLERDDTSVTGHVTFESHEPVWSPHPIDNGDGILRKLCFACGLTDDQGDKYHTKETSV